MEYGSPEIIQCDQGGDFKKALKLLRDRMNIKLIYIRPRHNQSQGKVERYHKGTKIKDGIWLSKDRSIRCKVGETAPSLSKNSK